MKSSQPVRQEEDPLRDRLALDNACIVLLRGDITEARVDAVVNAANPTLLGGEGVDGAIHRRGGPRILEECQEIRLRLGTELPIGDAVITTGGDLPARHVIHTVGPRFGVDPNSSDLLAAAYRRSLEVAKENRLPVVAFPSISTGAYGYPTADAAEIALRTVRDCLSGPTPHATEVRFVLFSDRDLRIYAEALSQS